MRAAREDARAAAAERSARQLREERNREEKERSNKEAEDRSPDNEKLSAIDMVSDKHTEEVAKRRKLDADSAAAWNKQSIESKRIEAERQEARENKTYPRPQMPDRQNRHIQERANIATSRVRATV